MNACSLRKWDYGTFQQRGKSLLTFERKSIDCLSIFEKLKLMFPSVFQIELGQTIVNIDKTFYSHEI